MMRVFLTFLMLFAAAAFAGPQPKIHTTQTTVSCAPDPATLFTATTCTATVTDLGGQGPDTPPDGSVTFSSDASGSFSASSCALTISGAVQSSCSVTYTPTAYDGGTHNISASYGGGSDPNPSTGIIFDPSNGSYALTLQYPLPAIASITPATGVRGDAVNVTVTGSGFTTGTALDLGANISVTGVNVVSSSELTATLTIADIAALGARSVTVSNPAPGGGSDTLVNGFEVRNPIPAISSLSPASVEVGSGAVVVTINGSGFVSDSVAYFDGGARATTFVTSTQLQMSLTAGDTSAIGDYSVHVTNGTPGGGDSANVLFSVVASGGSFDVVESSGNIGDALYTKLAGTAFSVDVLATDVGRVGVDTGFTGDVRIELLDAADDSGVLDANGCRASWGVAQVLPDGAFSGGDNGRINLGVSHPAAMRVARFRISHPASGAPTHVGCSSDAFSIRPSAFTLSTSLTNDQPDGTPVHAAGTNFSMTVESVAGYDGTPQLDAGSVTPHAGTATLSGTFPAADDLTGESAGTAFSYDEVGNFTLAAEGVRDETFTAVDQPDDCTADFANTEVGGKFGCYIGTVSDQVVGRFVPDHFDVTVTDACTDDTGFTYSGQPFNTTITARNASGGVTQNYQGGFAKDVVLSIAGDTSGFVTGTNLVSALDFSSGTATNPDVAWLFADPETAYTFISLRATDEDSVTSAGFVEESTEIRSGRITLGNASSITTMNGLLSLALQSWQEIAPGEFAWETHAADSTCTTLAIGAFSLGNYTANLDAGETSILSLNWSAGAGSLSLSAPGAGNSGSVEVTAAVDSWLEFNWNGSGREDPVGQVRFFEVFDAEQGMIDRHEVIN